MKQQLAAHPLVALALKCWQNAQKKMGQKRLIMTLIKVIIWKYILRRLDDGDGKSITKHFRPSNFFLVLSPVTVLYPRLLAFSKDPDTYTPLHTRGLIIA